MSKTKRGKKGDRPAPTSTSWSPPSPALRPATNSGHTFIGSLTRFAVVSDLHMFSASDPGRIGKQRATPSYLCTDTDLRAGDHRDPLQHLCDLIKSDGLRADALLCPGDLGDIASETGIRAAWQRLKELAQLMGASYLIGTPGNHDLNHNHYEPEECLKALSDFPLPDPDRRKEFWTDHFTIMDGSHYRLVCINSCAYHDGGDPERNFGRFSPRSRRSLDAALRHLGRKQLQLLLCHHHPQQHSEYRLGETDVMKEGQLLLDLLGRHGNWLVVHGHKHHPKLTRAAGHNSAPWLFAAGSVAAVQNPSTAGHARNQFYILEFDVDSFSTLGWGGVGRAWDWATEDGWSPAGHDSGLPARFGFGYAGDLSLLVRSIATDIPPASEGYRDWAELSQRFPIMGRLSPRDIEELAHFALRIQYGDDGCPLQVARHI